MRNLLSMILRKRCRWRAMDEQKPMRELTRIREERGLSQLALANLSGVNKATINQIERGRRSPNLETLEKLAGALAVELADFFPKAQAPLLDPNEERRQERATVLRWVLERAADNGKEVAEAWKAGDEHDIIGWMREDMEAYILLREWGATVGNDPELRAIEGRLKDVRKLIDNLAHQLIHARPEQTQMTQRFLERYTRPSELPTQEESPASAWTLGA